jgi:hypothetical protein
VRELDQDSRHALASAARSDSDVRVRGIAVEKIDDADLLLETGKGRRSLATARAEDLLLGRAISRRATVAQFHRRITWHRSAPGSG